MQLLITATIDSFYYPRSKKCNYCYYHGYYNKQFPLSEGKKCYNYYHRYYIDSFCHTGVKSATSTTTIDTFYFSGVKSATTTTTTIHRHFLLFLGKKCKY